MSIIDDMPNRQSVGVTKASQSFWLEGTLKIQKEAISKGETAWTNSCALMQALLNAKENGRIYGLKTKVLSINREIKAGDTIYECIASVTHGTTGRN